MVITYVWLETKAQINDYKRTFFKNERKILIIIEQKKILIYFDWCVDILIAVDGFH